MLSWDRRRPRQTRKVEKLTFGSGAIAHWGNMRVSYERFRKNSANRKGLLHMQVTPSRRSAVLNAVFMLLTGLGILTALLGIGMDVLPGSYPGLSLPQLLLTAAGLALALVAFALRSAAVRRRVLQNMRKHWAPGLLITVMTLIVLEFVLAAADIHTYFPPDIPEQFLAWKPWRTCDEAGCRHIYDAMVAACENGEISDRRCIVNRQGFGDTQDFVRGDDFDERMRLLMLGDSFAFGMSADIGKSYVETIEANFPQSIVWNTGMPITGTEQALTLFRVYAPVLQPQLTILGFYRNDFKDNTLPMDTQLWVGEDDRRIFLRRHQFDDSGNVIVSDKQKGYYYYLHGVEPPDSELERLIGRTRLGSLLLRMMDMAQGKARTRWERGRDITREYLRDLRDAAAARDTALLVLLIPDREDLLSPTPYYENALAIMEELDIPYLNPRHALDIRDYMLGTDVHWNNAGHQKIGAMLSDCLAVFQISGDLSDCEQVKMPSGKSEA